MKWIKTGSVVMQTEEYRLKTSPVTSMGHEIDGVELVLFRGQNGTWMLACAQLWSNGASHVVAPSDTPLETAKTFAVNAANARMTELARSLFSSANRALGRAV